MPRHANSVPRGQIRAVLQCVVADHLEPALRDLDDASRYQPVRERKLGEEGNAMNGSPTPDLGEAVHLAEAVGYRSNPLEDSSPPTPPAGTSPARR